jgi:hypothetical protein
LSLQLVPYLWLRKRKDLNFWERERDTQEAETQTELENSRILFLQLLLMVEKKQGLWFLEERERDKQSWKSQGFFFLQLLLIVERQSGMYFSHFPYFLSELWAFCHILHLVLLILLNKSFCSNENNWSWALGTLPRI